METFHFELHQHKLNPVPVLHLSEPPPTAEVRHYAHYIPVTSLPISPLTYFNSNCASSLHVLHFFIDMFFQLLHMSA